ncbi:MAG: FABP family protein [Chloroflexi bacterium]|nr:FABP family protein [Chloroflexota bacterium]
MATPIGFLAGVWRGSGTGEFPTMEPFAYEEEIRFLELGVPSLVYQQRAWSPDDDELLHLETGIWRSSPDGDLAVSVALPRVTEISEGRIVDGTISLVATSVRRAEGGAALVAVERTYAWEADEIRYRIAMATEEVGDITHHLAGTLRRVSPPPR